MTGKWLRCTAAPRFGRLGIGIGETTLWFVDVRRFGCVAFVDDPRAALTRGHGPDALNEPLTGRALGARLRGRRALKVALMDQSVIAGLGNIHAVEVLWRARLHPGRPAGSLGEGELDALSEAIVAQLQQAIEAEEGTVIDYVGEAGHTSSSGRSRFVVYGRGGQPCPRCAAPIEDGRHSGRATFWCPGCQPAWG